MTPWQNGEYKTKHLEQHGTGSYLTGDEVDGEVGHVVAIVTKPLKLEVARGHRLQPAVGEEEETAV